MQTFLPSLCGAKPGTTAAKVKPKSQLFAFLLGDNIKQAAKDTHLSQELTKNDYKKDFKRNRQSQTRDHTKSFLYYGKKSCQNYNQPSPQCIPFFCSSNNNSNNSGNNVNQKS